MPGSHGANDKTNPLAIASLVTGLLGCFAVLGAILGFIALNQIKQRGGRGRGMAVAGIVLSVLWTIGGAVTWFFIFAAASDDDRSDGIRPTDRRTGKKVDVKQMKVGDCINDNSGAATATDAPVEVSSVKIVPCNGPHDGEVLSVFRLSAVTMPSDAEMSRQARLGCRARIGARLNRDPAASQLASSFYYPTAATWARGDRMVTCVAVHATEGRKLTRRLRA
ncbi:DUF4190 domain-containing protein [Spirillospora albida]|uniref:DUF4190 domain-containing protein n=1 Tax=Spirillospora albida TaxID=58123 RepID=UPI0004C1451A|nr:DUF4190 domain-containing protein [Spirillospora albida]